MNDACRGALNNYLNTSNASWSRDKKKQRRAEKRPLSAASREPYPGIFVRIGSDTSYYNDESSTGFTVSCAHAGRKPQAWAFRAEEMFAQPQQ